MTLHRLREDGGRASRFAIEPAERPCCDSTGGEQSQRACHHQHPPTPAGVRGRTVHGHHAQPRDDRRRRRGRCRERRVEIRDERRTGRVALLRRLGEAAREDGVQCRGERRLEMVDRRRRLVRVGRRLGRLALPLERPPSGEELECDTRQRVPVARRGGRLPACLFRSHVADGPEHRPHLGERVLIGRAGDPEVGDADRLVVGDQQVPQA